MPRSLYQYFLINTLKNINAISIAITRQHVQVALCLSLQSQAAKELVQQSALSKTLEIYRLFPKSNKWPEQCLQNEASFLINGPHEPFVTMVTYRLSSIRRLLSLNSKNMQSNGLYVLLWRCVKTEMNFGMQYQGFTVLILEATLYTLFYKRHIFHKATPSCYLHCISDRQIALDNMCQS